MKDKWKIQSSANIISIVREKDGTGPIDIYVNICKDYDEAMRLATTITKALNDGAD